VIEWGFGEIGETFLEIVNVRLTICSEAKKSELASITGMIGVVD